MLSPGVTKNICEQLIMPRLERAVEAWSPTADVVPLHMWLHPWLPWLGDRLKAVYPAIRNTLARVLQVEIEPNTR